MRNSDHDAWWCWHSINHKRCDDTPYNESMPSCRLSGPEADEPGGRPCSSLSAHGRTNNRSCPHGAPSRGNRCMRECFPPTAGDDSHGTLDRSSYPCVPFLEKQSADIHGYGTFCNLQPSGRSPPVLFPMPHRPKPGRKSNQTMQIFSFSLLLQLPFANIKIISLAYF